MNRNLSAKDVSVQDENVTVQALTTLYFTDTTKYKEGVLRSHLLHYLGSTTMMNNTPLRSFRHVLLLSWPELWTLNAGLFLFRKLLGQAMLSDMVCSR